VNCPFSTASPVPPAGYQARLNGTQSR